MEEFPSNVKLLSTQRIINGGRSSNSFKNFNLALHVNDNYANVIANRNTLKNQFNLPSEPIWINQTHSSICIDATSINTIIELDNQRKVLQGERDELLSISNKIAKDICKLYKEGNNLLYNLSLRLNEKWEKDPNIHNKEIVFNSPEPHDYKNKNKYNYDFF